MWVDTKTFSLYVYSEYKFFTAQQKPWVRRIFDWLDLELEAFELTSYLEDLVLLALVNYKQELAFIVKLVEGCGYVISSFRLQYYKTLDKNIVKSHRKPKLALTCQVITLLDSLEGADK